MNEKIENSGDLEKIRQIAVEWIVKGDHGLSPGDQDELNEWLTSDSRHSDVYFEELSSWEELDRLIGMNESYKHPVNPDLLDDDVILPPKGRFLKRALYFSFPLAALFLFFLIIYPGKMEEVPLIPVEVAQERVLERIRRQHLEDGSLVSLNRGADIKTEFTKDERLVYLYEGEANFEVAKDVSRPFVVDIYGVRVKAVGTAFNVRLSDQVLDVIVTEGVVSLQTANDSVENSRESLLEVNYQATVSLEDDKPNVRVEVLEDQVLQEELLWHPVLIEFTNAPLSDIIDEFNRRNPLQIVVSDPSLRSMLLTSVFWSDNVDGFIRLLEGKFKIKARQNRDGTVYLYSI